MSCEFCHSECAPCYTVSRGTLASTMHQCTVCLSARLNPPFAAAILQDFYENSYFQAADWEVNKSAILAVDYFRKVQPFFVGGTTVRSLDVGAGFGHFARAYAAQTGRSIDIVEPSASCRKVVAAHSQVGNVYSSLRDLPEDRAYDQVFCFHVAEHLQEFASFATGLREKMVSGGRLFILTPNGASSSFREFGAEWGWACPEQHYQFLSDRIPENYFAKLGLRVVFLKDVCPAVIHYPSRWLTLIKRRIGMLNTRIPCLALAPRLVRKCERRLLAKTANVLQQNLTNYNLALVEKFLAKQTRGRSHDELMLVLENLASCGVARPSVSPCSNPGAEP